MLTGTSEHCFGPHGHPLCVMQTSTKDLGGSMDASAAGAAAAMGTERKPSVASSKSTDVRTEHEVWRAAS